MKILYFSAKWCGPCSWFGPLLETVIQDFPTLTLSKIDYDENMIFAMDNSVSSLPTIILMDNGQEVKRQIGALMEKDLRMWLVT